MNKRRVQGRVHCVTSLWHQRTVTFALLAVLVPLGLAAQTAPSADTMVVITPGARYMASGIHKFFFGSDYRDLWTTPIEVEVKGYDLRELRRLTEQIEAALKRIPALKDIKTDPRFRRIPVIVLTTSKAEEDILRTYDLGVNSFIVKPVTFDSLVDIMRTVTSYWLQIVSLPPNGRGRRR